MKTNLMLNAMSDKGISGITKHTTSEQLDAFFLNNKEAMVKAHMDTSHEESRSVAIDYVSEAYKSTFNVATLLLQEAFGMTTTQGVVVLINPKKGLLGTLNQ